MKTTSSIEEHKALVTRFFAAIETEEFQAFDEIVAENYDDHLPGRTPGRESLKKYFMGLHSAFADLKLPITAMIAEGDRVAVLNSVRGKHKSDFLGIQAKGNSIDAMAFQLYRIADGKLAEHWEVADFMTLMRQLND